MIYVIGEVEGDTPVKLGVTTDLVGRMKSFQLHTWRQLDVLAVASGGLREERRLHSRFAASRCRSEWYFRTDEIRAFIADNAVSEAFDLVVHLRSDGMRPTWCERKLPSSAIVADSDEFSRATLQCGECRCRRRASERAQEELERVARQVAKQEPAPPLPPPVRFCTIHTRGLVVFAEGRDEQSARAFARDWILRNAPARTTEADAVTDPANSRVVWKAA